MGSVLKAVFHCSRFACADEVTDFNLVKNQWRGHAKNVKCSSTSKRVRAHKSRQKTLRLHTYNKSWNMFAPPAQAKRLQWKLNELNCYQFSTILPRNEIKLSCISFFSVFQCH